MNKYFIIRVAVCIAICIMILVCKFNMFESFNVADDKIAFLFLTRNNLNCPDIWNAFFDKNSMHYNIYSHVKEPEKLDAQCILRDKMIPEYVNTCWGCIGVIEANILLLKNALKDPRNKKFILVSEACIPIVSFNTFYNTVMRNNKSRIGIQKINTSLERYNMIKNPPFPINQFIKHSAQGLIFNRYHASILVDTMQANLDNWKAMSSSDEHYNGNILRLYDIKFNDNNENVKTTFDIWQVADLQQPVNIELQTYILLDNVPNETIDKMRSAGFLLCRKIDKNSKIDRKYILQT